MKKICCTISYDGKAYAGWQKQPKHPTIQEQIERSLQSLFQKPISILGASRTDAGVHAYDQKASFYVPKEFSTNRLPAALNAYLPKDISVLHAQEVPDDFHPIKNCIKKTYSYTLYLSRQRLPLMDKQAVQMKKSLNLAAIESVLPLFLGKKDFKSFCSIHTTAKTTVRTIHAFTMQLKEPMLRFEITANGFLYHMVRIIMGTVIDVGLGKINEQDVMELFKKNDRNFAGPTMPSHGLILEKIEY